MDTPTTSIPPSLLIMKGAVPDYKATALALAAGLANAEKGLVTQSNLIQRKNLEAANLQSALDKCDATLDRYLNPSFWDRIKFLFGFSL